MMFRNLRGEVREQEPLAAHTSFRIGGPADYVAFPADRRDLIALLAQVRERGLRFVILGGGTNLLVRDGGFRGVVISLARLAAIVTKREYRSLGGSFAVVHAEAGAPLPKVLRHAVEQELGGLEFAAGIPGTVGGAVCMNAGTAQGEMGDVIDAVTMLSPNGGLIVRNRDEMGFGYRRANVPPGHVVLDAKIILRRVQRERIKAAVKELMAVRKERQPWGLPSAGSVFKNPLDEAAGKLIETAGLKGMTVGRAQVSEKHANFIVNLGGARAADVLKLMDIVQERVLAAHKIRLEPEIKIIGDD
jgi:UDP-N-acetylmuramate dehydrogenase